MNFTDYAMPVSKRKTLPNTIKLTRAMAGEPRSYTEAEVEKIVAHLGALPAGKILYPGRFPPFHILGEELPGMQGMFQAYLRDAPAEQKLMTREIVALYCLEEAAWEYKRTKIEKRKGEKTPSQKLKALKKIENACDVLIKDLPAFEFPGIAWQITRLKEDAQDSLVPLRGLLQYQKKLLLSQKAPSKKRHQPDTALRELVRDLCIIWTEVAGRKLTSGSVSPDSKKVSGPIIAFIQEAFVPLGIKKTPGAIREMLRDIKVKSKPETV